MDGAIGPSKKSRKKRAAAGQAGEGVNGYSSQANGSSSTLNVSNPSKRQKLDRDGLLPHQVPSVPKYQLKSPSYWTSSASTKSTPATSDQQFYPLLFTFSKAPKTDLPKAPIRSWCLLSALPLVIESFGLNLNTNGELFPVAFQAGGKALLLNEDRRTQSERFTHRIFRSLTNKALQPSPGPERQAPFWIVPFKSQNYGFNYLDDELESLIDWELLELLSPAPFTNEPFDLELLRNHDTDINIYPDALVASLSDLGPKQYLLEVRHDLTPLSTPLYGEREFGHPSYIAYIESAKSKKNSKSPGVSQEIDPDQPLLEIAKVPDFVNNLLIQDSIVSSDSKRPPVSPPPKYMIPQRSYLSRFPASVYSSALYLPSILTALDQALTATELSSKMFASSVKQPLLMEALSTSALGQQQNYERLEFFGDAILKLVATSYLITRHPTRTVHDLRDEKQKLIRNTRLKTLGVSSGLTESILHQQFNLKSWVPHGWTVEGQATHPDMVEISDNVVADVVEACLGASYLSAATCVSPVEYQKKALDNSLLFLKSLKHPLEVSRWSELQGSQLPVSSQQINISTKSIQEVESIIGYTFDNKRLLEVAFSLRNADQVDRDRFESLGDAFLDYEVALKIFHRFPDATPAVLNLFKFGMVSNQTLSALAISSSLYKFMTPYHELPIASSEFVQVLLKKLEESKEGPVRSAGTSLMPHGVPWWNEFEPPKLFADIVEALIGAALVDSKFDLQVSKTIFQKLVEPFLDQYITTESSLPVHPNVVLLNFFRSRGCNAYQTSRKDILFEGSSRKIIRVIAIYHGVQIGEGQGADENTANRFAGAAALNWIDNNPKKGMHLCTCPNKKLDVSIYT